MRKLTIGTEPKQKITVLFEDTTIVIELTFRPTIQSWTMDIAFRGEKLINGKKLVIGLPLLKQFNKPFDIILFENQNTGIDPFKQDDFQDRVSVYLMEREDLIAARGYDVV